jgi:hypothetical protein
LAAAAAVMSSVESNGTAKVAEILAIDHSARFHEMLL